MLTDLKKIWKLLIPFKLRLTGIIVLNLFSVIFSIFSITMLAPFLSVLFNQQPPVTEPPAFAFRSENLMAFLQYLLANIIRLKGTTFALAAVILFIFVLFLLKNTFGYLSLATTVPMRTSILKSLRDNCFHKLLTLPLSFYAQASKGDVLSRTINDIQEIDTSVLQYVQQLLKEGLTLLLFLAMLLFVQWKFTLFILITAPAFAFIISSIQRKLKRKSIQAKQQEGSLLALSEESIYGLRVIKAFHAIPYQRQRFLAENEKYNRLIVRINRMKDLSSPVSDFLGMCMVVFILVLGCRLVGKEHAFPAEIFITYLVLFTQIINPIKTISDATANFKKGFASLHRIDELLASDEKILELPQALPIASFEKEIRLDSVGFSYDESTKVLHQISFTIPKGQMIALCGSSGSGKSTIADLLLRFYDVDEGCILMDGTDIRQLKINDLRNLFSIVSQESILFNDTIFNNIAFGKENASEADVWKAAEMAHIDQFIHGLEKGLQTEIGDRGMNLSGGQRQRISIARAFLKNAPILILDEATSALDTESEKEVQKTINELMKDKTSLVIAHRLSTIADADEILVMEQGKIIERGKHSTLMAQQGTYRKLVELQSFDKN